jgi:hypothetical protein
VMLKMIIPSTAGLKIWWKSQLKCLWGVVDLNSKLWKIWNGRNLALALIN